MVADRALQQVDASYPFHDEVTRALLGAGVSACAVYVGGVNNGGRAWKPEHPGQLAAAGITRQLPIYVGENTCRTCKVPLDLSYRAGSGDSTDAILCANRYGYYRGPLALDIEWDTATRAGVYDYVTGWALGAYRGGFLPVIYAPPFFLAKWHPPVTCAAWVTYWVDSTEQPRFYEPGEMPYWGLPWLRRYVAWGWQYAPRYHAGGTVFDLSVMDSGIYVPLPGVITQMGSHYRRYFPETHHSVGGTFLTFYESYLDRALPTFGYPISEEYTDPETELQVQYFERARMEWHPAEQAVMLGLLGVQYVEVGRVDSPAFGPVAA